MTLEQMLQRREELNYELIEAIGSKQITSITNEIFDLEAQIEMSTGKTIDEIDSNYQPEVG